MREICRESGEELDTQRSVKEEEEEVGNRVWEHRSQPIDVVGSSLLDRFD